MYSSYVKRFFSTQSATKLFKNLAPDDSRPPAARTSKHIEIKDLKLYHKNNLHSHQPNFK